MRFLPYFFLIVVTLFLFGNTLIPPPGKIIYGGDLNDQFYFWKSYYVGNIKRGIVPFWNPYNFSGTPFLAHPSVAPFYPFNLIFFVFPLNLAFSVYLFIHLLLAGFFMYWYSQRTLDVLSSLVSASIFALSGLFAARIYAGHIDIISTIIWIPLVFGSITQALERFKQRDFLLAILSLTMQILASYQLVVILTLELIILYLLFQFIIAIAKRQRAGRFWHKFILLVFIIFASYGLSAVQFLPTWQLVSHSIRAKGLPYEVSTWGSFTADSFKLFISPFAFGNPFPDNYSYKGPGPNYFELVFFVGVIPILSLMIYLVGQIIKLLQRKKTNQTFLFYFFALPFFVLMAMGNQAPLNLHKLLFDLFPPYRLFRMPAQHLIIVVFLLAAAVGVVVTRIHFALMKFVVLLFVVVELIRFDKKFIRLTSLPTANFDPNLLKVLQGEKELFRFLPDYRVGSEIRYTFDFESSSFFKIQSSSGYNPMILNNYHRFIDLLDKNLYPTVAQYNVEIPPPTPLSPLIDFLNIKYIQLGVGFDEIKSNNFKKFKPVLETLLFRLYENMAYLPRFYIVNNVLTYSSREKLENAIIKDMPDLSENILLVRRDRNDELTPDLDCKDKATKNVTIVSYTPNRILLNAKTSCSGFLVSSEVYYPGWKSKIDGSTTPVYKSNLAFRSIYIPEGEYVVEFYYAPTIYYLGGMITLITTSFLIFFLKSNYILFSRPRK